MAVGNRCWGGEKRWKKKMGAGSPEKGRQKKKSTRPSSMESKKMKKKKESERRENLEEMREGSDIRNRGRWKREKKENEEKKYIYIL